MFTISLRVTLWFASPHTTQKLWWFMSAMGTMVSSPSTRFTVAMLAPPLVQGVPPFPLNCLLFTLFRPMMYSKPPLPFIVSAYSSPL